MADRRTTLKLIFLGDVDHGIKALRDIKKEAAASASGVQQSANKIEASFKGVENQAKKSRLPASMGGTGAAQFRNLAEAGLQGTVTPLSTIQSAALAQFGGAEKLLSGISTKTLAVGAGMAVAGVAAVKFGQASVRNFREAAAAVDSFQDVTGASAEESSKMVFVADRLGVSSDQLAGAMFKLAKGAEDNRQKFADFGVEIARNGEGGVDLTETLANIAEAYSGMTDPADQARLVTLAFGRSGADLIDILEQDADGIRRLSEEAKKRAPMLGQEEIDLGVEFERTIQDLDNAWKRLTITTGPTIVKILNDAAKAAIPLVNAFEKINRIKGPSGLDVAKGIPLGPSLTDIKGPSGLDLIRSRFGSVGDAVDKTTAATARWGGAMKGANVATQSWASGLRNAASAAGSAASAFGLAAFTIESLAAATASALSGFQNFTRDAGRTRDSTNDYANALSALDDLQTSTASSSQSYARAVESSNESVIAAEESLNDAYRSVADAQQGVAKAREAAAKQIQDAEEAAAEAAQDYAKAQQDAAESIAEAEEDAAKRIVDAQQRVIDVRERAARQLQDAEDRLTDARQAAADALSEALGDNPFEAQRRREEAVRDLQRAEREYGESTTDARKEVADAEQDVAETQKEAAKSVSDAQEQAAERILDAQKRMIDSQEALAEAHQSAAESIASAQGAVSDAHRGAERASRDLERAMRDATQAQNDAAESAANTAPKIADVDQKMQGLVDATFKEVFQMRQLGASSAETEPKIAAAEQKIRDTAAALGWSEQQTEAYIRQLRLIPSQVNTWVVLQMDASQYRNEMRRVAQTFRDIETQNLFNQGIVEVIGGYQAYPQFARGGIYHAPMGQDSGLAMLHDREAVFTPEQLATLGFGGGLTINVAGAVISERELMDIVARAQRRGYR